jgi:hypothetical protein
MDIKDADRTFHLDRPATIGDVIAWVLAVPTVVLGLYGCPFTGAQVPKFMTMFDALHAKLPTMTILVLSAARYQWFFYILLPYAIVGVMLAVLVRAERGAVKVITAAVAGFIVLQIVLTTIVAIVWPIMELQKQLS